MGRKGYKYTHWKNYHRDNSNDSFNQEGVIKRHHKWVVRVKNPTNSKTIRPFISLSQHDTKDEAIKRYNNYKLIA